MYLFGTYFNFKYAINSFAAARPALFAPMVEEEGPYPVRWILGSWTTSVANDPPIVIPPCSFFKPNGSSYPKRLSSTYPQ